jgi:hypothetical protein
VSVAAIDVTPIENPAAPIGGPISGTVGLLVTVIGQVGLELTTSGTAGLGDG